ncbi:MAG: YidC/Oxa1 family insertase periplasmic-domain containing protein [Planctomycetota bacterium]
MSIQQRRPQRGGEQPFDQRFFLFMIVALGVIMLTTSSRPPVGEKPADGEGQPLAVDPEVVADAEPEPTVPAVALEEEPVAEQERIALGSVDADDGYRMLLTVNNVGAAVERIELSSEDYRDLEDRSGYLGRLALTDASGGARINFVGPGTPAAEAGLQAGDVITSVTAGTQRDWEVADARTFEVVLDKTKPRSEMEITVLRDGEPTTVTATLTRQPLDLIRPEIENIRLHTPDGIDGFESVPSFVVRLASIDGRRDDAPALIEANRRLEEEAWTVEASDATGVTLRKRLADLGIEFVKRFTLVETPDAERDNKAHPSYHFELTVEVRNLTEQPHSVAYELTGPNGLPIEGFWYANKIGRGDGSFFGDWGSFGLRDLTVRFAGDRITQFASSSVAKGSVRPMGQGRPLAFVGVDSQYFASIILPLKDSLADVRVAEVRAELATEKLEGSGAATRWQNVSCVLQRVATTLGPAGADDATVSDGYRVFAGPKLPELLTQYAANEDAEHTLNDVPYYGWFGWVAKPMLGLLHFFYSLVGNYGLAIIMLTICVRGAMFPISRKTAMNMVKMQELKPEMDRIAERYGDDMQKRAAAQQELFRKHNYNPAAGCLPMFLQLPIFMGLYRALAVDVELRQQPLFSDAIRFCSNLASPDMLIDWSAYTPLWMDNGEGLMGFGPYLNLLPLLTCGLFLLQQQLFMPEPTNDQARLQQTMMKWMMLFMGLLFFKVPSGLCIYFIASSLWGIAERKMLPRPVPAAVPAEPVTPLPSNKNKGGGKSFAEAKKKAANKKKAKGSKKKR